MCFKSSKRKYACKANNNKLNNQLEKSSISDISIIRRLARDAIYISTVLPIYVY